MTTSPSRCDARRHGPDRCSTHALPAATGSGDEVHPLDRVDFPRNKGYYSRYYGYHHKGYYGDTLAAA